MKHTAEIFFFLLLIAGCQKSSGPGFSFPGDAGEITLEGYAGSEATFRFSSNMEWKASAACGWLDISPDSGYAGYCSITLKASGDNATGTERTASVLLSSLSVTHEITVRQAPCDMVELDMETYHVSSAGETLQIRFSTNVDNDELAIYGSAGWLVQDMRTRSTSSYIISLRAMPNTGTSSRTAYVYFYKEADGTRTLLKTATVLQEGTSTASSTDYSADKSVRVLHNAVSGKGLPVVIMGDGFIDTEIADGTYDKVMDKAMDNLFTEEPFKSLQDYFDVYAVTAVSKHNVFGYGYETAFGCELEGGNSTGIEGDDYAVMEYVESVDGIDLEECLAIVILNSSEYAGTTYFGYRGDSGMTEFAIAYCPVIDNLESESFRQVLVHEAVGHGFTKLEDEYSYEMNGRIPDEEIETVQYLQSLGWAQNVDFVADESTVLWADFLNDSRYASEGIGIYEGACTYMTGVYRPTYESMMNSNIEGFNAPSRKAMYDMVMKRALQQEPSYEDFVSFDLPLRQTQVRKAGQVSASVSVPLPHPRFVNKYLSSGK